MIVMLAALGLLSQVAGKADEPKGGPRAVIGTGSQPCAVAMTPGRRIEADTWTLGYWTGVNAAGPANVRAEGGVEGMLGQVHAYCAGHTGVPLSDAVQAVLSAKN